MSANCGHDHCGRCCGGSCTGCGALELTQDELSLLRRFAQLLSGCQPVDLLLVMLGGNDLLQGADAAGVAARMEAFLTQIPLPREQIVLIGPPPVKPGAWVTEERLVADSVGLAAAYQALSQKLGTRFVDAVGLEIALTFDGVHFSEEGHKTFAENLYLALKQ